MESATKAKEKVNLCALFQLRIVAVAADSVTNYESLCVNNLLLTRYMVTVIAKIQ